MQGQDCIGRYAVSTSTKVSLGRQGWGNIWIPAELRSQPGADNFALARLLGLGRSLILSMKGTLLIKFSVHTDRSISGFKQQFQSNFEGSIVDHKYIYIYIYCLHPTSGANIFVKKWACSRFGVIKIKK